MPGQVPAEILRRAARVQLLIFDVDGVLTDGRLWLSNDGSELKAFHTRDGHGLKRLQEAGVTCAIISGRRSSAVERRMAELGIEHAFQGIEDKLAAYRSLLADLDLTPEQSGYVGDDVVDLPVMSQVGFAVAVADAYETVRAAAHWVTSKGGGHGAAREVCELILLARSSQE
jgi:3-deoxy-D-manno-octulosonate 8-phosphate phosphatase (KDO 8-P phosphatase)